ncbi:MAG: alpha/beta fold hydrolase [Acidimicrobiia bacterium]|nr:alpha/beta fold hydrolase [Acidimicrobiia bacterium]MDH4306981.1 alpha/beta fold hydrolase [Acidimicrobiia bacterium]
MTLELGFAPSEDPFVVQHGGFYRRWLSMINDVGELEATVSKLTGTTHDLWVPVWHEVGSAHERRGDEMEAAGDFDGARDAYLQAKTYYAIGRFPGEVSDVKRAISDDCARAYRKACAHLEPPMTVVEVPHEGRTIRSHYRVPASASPSSPVPAVLIMCGADVFKEDRGWAQDYCLEYGMAALVMDAPGTGENPFPWSPESVSAWVAAVDWLAARPEVDGAKIGAFGISRGGYSVMQLAGVAPDKVKAVVASAGHPFGYVMTDDELDEFVAVRNQRSTWKFGAPDDPPSFAPTSPEQERAAFSRWALSELGLVDRITQPVLMINGKRDHLAPIGNIYYMLENGPATGRQARVYADDGHCAFKHFKEWAPASFEWLAGHLG